MNWSRINCLKTNRTFKEIFERFLQSFRIHFELIKTKMLFLLLCIETYNNIACQELIDTKCRWCFDQLDRAGSNWEPLGQMKAMQICQRETQSHQGAITHEVCCLSAQLPRNKLTKQLT